MVDFKRKVTHTSYKYEKQLKKYYHRVEKKIYKLPHGLDKLSKKEEEKYRYTTDQYIMLHTKGTMTPFLGGGISLALVISSLFSDDTFEGFGLYLFIFFSFLTVFFATYYFTKPALRSLQLRSDMSKR